MSLFSLEKDVYERYLLSSDLANQASGENATERPLWVYCTLSVHFERMVSIFLDVGYRVAYPDARQCESPTMG